MGFPERAGRYLSRRRRAIILLLGSFMAAGGVAAVANHVLVGHYDRHIHAVQELPDDPAMVGVVFGAGLRQGRPTPLLVDRLDAAAELLTAGAVRELIVSGDNRISGYDEPAAMREYLVSQRRVDPDLIQEDKAGRSTYETCERATKIFGLERAVLISESSHLPRAIYTCRKFGIEAYGFPSDGPALARNPSVRITQRLREVLARGDVQHLPGGRAHRTGRADPM